MEIKANLREIVFNKSDEATIDGIVVEVRELRRFSTPLTPTKERTYEQDARAMAPDDAEAFAIDQRPELRNYLLSYHKWLEYFKITDILGERVGCFELSEPRLGLNKDNLRYDSARESVERYEREGHRIFFRRHNVKFTRIYTQTQEHIEKVAGGLFQ